MAKKNPDKQARKPSGKLEGPKQPGKRKKKPTTKHRTKKERIMAFLTAYAQSCNIVAAAKKAEVSLRSHYTWLKKHPKYAELFNEMKRQAADYLENVAVDRATEGWLEPVFYQGNRCGSVRRYDGGLLQFLLRGMMPDRYGHKTEISGPQGQPIETKIEVVFLDPPRELEPGKE